MSNAGVVTQTRRRDVSFDTLVLLGSSPRGCFPEKSSSLENNKMAEVEGPQDGEDSSYWWERMFGGCSCVTDESALMGGEIDVSKKVKVTDDGKVVATVTSEGEYLVPGEDIDEKATFSEDAKEKDETTSETIVPLASSEKNENEDSSSPKEEDEVVVPVKKETRSESSMEPPVRKNSSISVDLGQVKTVLKGDGLPFKKHCRDGKIRNRVLVLTSDEKFLGWKKNDPKKRVPLAAIKEVRLATAIDPSSIDEKRPLGLAGTETLRKSADGPAVCRKAFSLILDDRTVDIQCDTDTEAKQISAALKVIIDQAKA